MIKPYRTTLLAAGIAAALGMGASTLLAAPYGAPAGGNPVPTNGPLPGMMLDRMSDRLQLSEDQQTRIEKILEADHEARAKADLELRQKIFAVLTPEQIQQRDEMIDKAVAFHVQRMAARLNLTPEQEKSVQDLLAQEWKKPTLTNTELHEKIAGFLSDQQREYFNQSGPGQRPGPWSQRGPMQGQRQGPMQGRMPGAMGDSSCDEDWQMGHPGPMMPGNGSWGGPMQGGMPMQGPMRGQMPPMQGQPMQGPMQGQMPPMKGQQMPGRPMQGQMPAMPGQQMPAPMYQMPGQAMPMPAQPAPAAPAQPSTPAQPAQTPAQAPAAN